MFAVAAPASPLLEAGHYDAPASPRSSSNFVLLTTADVLEPAEGELATRPHLDSSPSAPTRLARPRFLPVLQVATLLDLVTTVGLALRVPIKTLPPSTVAINLARSPVVGAVLASPRVRELGPVILAQLAVTALVLLFRLNELVQTNAAFSPPSLAGDNDAAADFLNPTTEWYLASFGWSCLHYLLFAAFVGFTRERNPLAGRMKRSSTWGEQRWEGTQVAVDGATLAGSIRSRSSVSGGGTGIDAGGRASVGDGEYAYSGTVEEGSATGSDLDGSSEEEDDENDIVDVPRQYRGGGLTAATSTLRHRSSHASFLSVRGPAQADPSLSTSPRSRLASGLGAVRNYGSINSLGKSLGSCLDERDG